MSQTVEVRRAGVVQDPCEIALPLSITHGRSDVTNQPDPPAAQVIWDGQVCPWTVGDNLEIWAGTQYEPAVYDDPVRSYDDPAATYDSTPTGEVMRPHFVGTVAGLTATGMLGQVVSWTVDAVGGLARLGTTPITVTRPQERDTDRVQGIAAAAGVAVRVVGAPGVLLAATPAASPIDTDALTALHDVCTSSGGLVWQAKDGTLTYGTAAHRTAAQYPVAVIPCDVIDHAVAWDEDVEAIINEVTVRWGPADNQQENTHRLADSIAMPWGVRHTDITTMCADQANADELAVLVLARRGWPFYGVTNGLVDLHSPDMSRQFAELDVSSSAMVPIPSTPGPTPSDLTPVVVEGWVEVWDAADVHTAQAAFSDQKRWVTTTLRDYAEVLAGGDYGYWLAHGDYMAMLVKQGA